ncbi:uncharacterized protein N7483_005278 [Penicillium malachiteum]|uniref:uncharacterized protein n=1 Tax=Penicillium malachiteum TaxID=1324776 RepID=UPI002546EE12|nr:uncharacterized protein N7483_005278 [Penicillium malachiteum]KAJ5730770.1 hypothetical protein N7483_005278 [Penicillium malachiteum]
MVQAAYVQGTTAASPDVKAHLGTSDRPFVAPLILYSQYMHNDMQWNEAIYPSRFPDVGADRLRVRSSRDLAFQPPNWFAARQPRRLGLTSYRLGLREQWGQICTM